MVGCKRSAMNSKKLQCSRREQEMEGRRTAMIPAMTTGTIHFIIRSGRRTPIAAIPTPDLEVPYEAPMPASR